MGLEWGLWLGFIVLFTTTRVIFSDQDGFLSLSCGGTKTFVDSSNITWVSDTSYITTGNTSTVDYLDGASSCQSPLRFFPNSSGRKCYKLPVKENISSSVLVRTRFMYKNYDGLLIPPMFFVSLGTAISATVNLTDTDPWTEEFVWPVDKDVLSLCLIPIPGAGFPVISTLELRPLPLESYRTGLEDFSSKLLRKTYRINCGYKNGSVRYPLDQYDRIWDSDENFSPVNISSALNIQPRGGFSLSHSKETPPSFVLQTARVLTRKDVLSYNLKLSILGDYYIVLYFAGIFPTFPSFDVLVNGEIIESDYTVRNSEVTSLIITQRSVDKLNITMKSIKFYPQINAIEVYEIVDIPPETSSTTVSALQVIQQSTGLDLGWQDDPCSPTPWDRIGCEQNFVTSLELSDVTLRSISPTFGDLLDLKTLDLHNTSLSGEIQNLGGLQHLQKLNLSFNQLKSFGSDLEDLINLQILDLQNNGLEGMVPESLGELKELHLLNLENNMLQGPLPQSLNAESLEVRTSGNLCLSFSTLNCNGASTNSSIEAPQMTILTTKNKKKNDHNHLAIMLGAIGGTVLTLLVVSLSLVLFWRRKKTEVPYTEGGGESMIRNWNAAKNFSYKEIKAATNNFKEVIGRGSFGAVYLGKLPDGKSVAVKMRFDKTQLGAESFMNEVSLLSQIRHQNLVTFEGFCHESKQEILVYEYLPGGSLALNLYGQSSKRRITLSWVRRLKIAIDAAKGLDYLHNASDPRIIHRDVKSSNILLDMEMNAKVCDFGLSKQVMHPDASHVTTVVKGTAGYLDPEYYSTQQLTEKSDVYSFGVVLLELICGREPLRRRGSSDSFNLVLWAKPYLQAGGFEIVDESLKGTFDAESMSKAALIASRSVERDASQRPNIAEVLGELKEAFTIQLAYLSSVGHGI